MRNFGKICTLSILGLISAAASQAATFNFKADLKDLSGLASGVAQSNIGSAKLTFDDIAMTLAVNITATGFAPGKTHLQHIHGPIGGNAKSPTLANDSDNDGVVELLEGAPLYGGILLQLFDEDNLDNGFDGFATVGEDRKISFSYTYDLATTGALNGVTFDALFPLEDREIVIHGANLSPFIGGVGNETDGDVFLNGGYSLLVPVAAGEIYAVPNVVPLPAAAWMLVAGLGGLGALRRFGNQKV